MVYVAIAVIHKLISVLIMFPKGGLKLFRWSHAVCLRCVLMSRVRNTTVGEKLCGNLLGFFYPPIAPSRRSCNTVVFNFSFFA
jgi:hypothetical protein